MEQELLWDFPTTCRQLKKTVEGLRWLVRTRRIPIVRVGNGRGRIYFSPEEVRAWIEKQKK